MARDLSGELAWVLDEWVGRHVVVRVVASTDDLIVVFAGRLEPCSAEKRPSLFWPVAADAGVSGLLEQPGIYAHPELLSDVRPHVGGFVVEFRQAEATVNVRLIDDS